MKNKKVLAVLGLAVVVAAGGTLAYFNQTMVAENEFDTGKYGNVLTETFNPKDGDKWEPGVEVNKDVEVTNTGDQPIVVRVKFDEAWSRDGENFKEIGAATIAIEDQTSQKITNVWQANPTDGSTNADDTVVQKIFANEDKWKLGTDGYYYYVDVLEGDSSTGTFLDSVKLAEDTDMGKEVKVYSYSAVIDKESFDGTVPVDCIMEDGSVDLEKLSNQLGLKEGDELTTNYVVTVDEDAKGYSEANYTLTITAETVQATTAAVEDMFGSTEPVEGLNWNLRSESLN